MYENIQGLLKLGKQMMFPKIKVTLQKSTKECVTCKKRNRGIFHLTYHRTAAKIRHNPDKDNTVQRGNPKRNSFYCDLF